MVYKSTGPMTGAIDTGRAPHIRAVIRLSARPIFQLRCCIAGVAKFELRQVCYEINERDRETLEKTE
jgi:hypothetical protein